MVIMKRRAIAVALVLLLTLGFIAACNKKPEPTTEESETSTEVSSDTEAEETSEETSESDEEPESEETESPEETGTSVETSVSETASAATSSSQTTAKAKVTVKVTNAVNKKMTFYKEEGKVKVVIPKVSISGKNMNSVNSKIKKELLAKKKAVSYSYYKNDKIVSICVGIQGWKDTDQENVVYNISVATGKLISGKEVVKIYGTTDKKFFNMVKKDYKKADFGVLFQPGKKATKKQKKLINKLRKKNLKRVSYKYVEPFITKKGKLSYVSSAYYYNVEMGEIGLNHW